MSGRYDPTKVFWITLLVAGLPSWLFAGLTLHALQGAEHWARNSPHFFVYVPIFMPCAAALLAAALIGGSERGQLRRRNRPWRVWGMAVVRWAAAPSRAWGVLTAIFVLVAALALVGQRKGEGGTRDVWEFDDPKTAIATDTCVRLELDESTTRVPKHCSDATATKIFDGRNRQEYDRCVAAASKETPPDAAAARRCLVDAWDAWANESGRTWRPQLAVDLIGVLVSVILFGAAAQWVLVRHVHSPAPIDIELLRLAYACAMVWFPLRLYALWYRNFYSVEAVATYDLFTAAAVLGVATGLLLVILGTGQAKHPRVDWAGVGGGLAAAATLIAQVFRPTQVAELFQQVEVFLQLASSRGTAAFAIVIAFTVLTWAFALVKAKAYLLSETGQPSPNAATCTDPVLAGERPAQSETTEQSS